MTVTANARLDPKKYGRLLQRTLPAVVESEQDNERLLAEVERLLDKGEENLSPEETAVVGLMVRLIEDFEARAYPIPDAAPHEVLRHLLEAHGLRQADLLPIFGSRGYTSDVVNGKRGISKTHAKQLGDLFHVTPALFL